jgi:hypothetical protein
VFTSLTVTVKVLAPGSLPQLVIEEPELTVNLPLLFNVPPLQNNAAVPPLSVSLRARGPCGEAGPAPTKGPISTGS